ncbi:MAG: phosphorylase [Bacteroidetes bacterium]|nr:MAG: phosphorylase [Bacteroidota bacterium]
MHTLVYVKRPAEKNVGFPMNSELILNADGSVYHLGLKPGELAEDIFFVGDPARTETVANLFDHIELRRAHREFHTITGAYGGRRLSVISTGIGTDNIDIVMQEADALFNIDLSTRQAKETLTPLRILRLGTCGGIQPDMHPGTLVLSAYAVGGDALMQYYHARPDLFRETLEFALRDYLEDNDIRASMYGVVCQGRFASAPAKIRTGGTFTAAGFYGPQGRAAGRIGLRYPDLPELMSGFFFQDMPILNMEMETSGILALGQALGHEAGSLSVVLANRRTRTFAQDPAACVEQLIEAGFELMMGGLTS